MFDAGFEKDINACAEQGVEAQGGKMVTQTNYREFTRKVVKECVASLKNRKLAKQNSE